jgi:hypothetical protein
MNGGSGGRIMVCARSSSANRRKPFSLKARLASSIEPKAI